jgi:hypothetical protein
MGQLTYGAQVCGTLELPWRDNTPKLSCIPVGTYTLRWKRSPSKGMCYEVLHVPGRGNVLIHSANFAGDVTKGFQSELQGCIAPCTRFGAMRNRARIFQLAGLVSKPATSAFNAWGNAEDILLTITGEA